MSKRLSYHKFNLLPLKQRWNLVCKSLEKLGYTFTDNPNKRDRQIKRALAEFQKNNGLPGNGTICEESFDLLNISDMEV